MRLRTAGSLATYVDGQRVRTRLVDEDADVLSLVRAELSDLGESAEVVVLDRQGDRLERWCLRGATFVRDWALPGVVARGPRRDRRSSSNPPPPRG